MSGYLLINGVLFVLFGLRCLLKPVEGVAVPYSLVADSIDARSYLRASAGGVTLLSGTLMLAAVWVYKLALPALLLSVVVFAGLVLGRAVSWISDGAPGLTPRVAGLLELLGLGFGVFWLSLVY